MKSQLCAGYIDEFDTSDRLQIRRQRQIVSSSRHISACTHVLFRQNKKIKRPLQPLLLIDDLKSDFLIQ